MAISKWDLWVMSHFVMWIGNYLDHYIAENHGPLLSDYSYPNGNQDGYFLFDPAQFLIEEEVEVVEFDSSDIFPEEWETLVLICNRCSEEELDYFQYRLLEIAAEDYFNGTEQELYHWDRGVSINMQWLDSIKRRIVMEMDIGVYDIQILHQDAVIKKRWTLEDITGLNCNVSDSNGRGRNDVGCLNI